MAVGSRRLVELPPLESESAGELCQKSALEYERPRHLRIDAGLPPLRECLHFHGLGGCERPVPMILGQFT